MSAALSTTSSTPLVLVVNDTEMALYNLSRILRAGGFRVAETRTGADALTRVRDLAPDLVVIEVHLPDMLGYEVTRRLRADPSTSSIPIVQTSKTFGGARERVVALDAGADAYLTQPIEAVELQAMTRSLLRIRRTELEIREKTRLLAEADARKNEFLAMLSHELRNPLSAILVGADLIDGGTGDQEDRRRFSQLVGRQARHLGGLVDELLDVSRLARGKAHLDRRPLNLVELVRDAVETARPAIERDHRELVSVLPPESLWVDGDARRLEQVISNLLDNASKYTARDSKIIVTLGCRVDANDAPRVVLSVADDGQGIAPENLAVIWEPFFQVQSGLDRAQGGLGVGLSVVRQIVEMHGGTVNVESGGLGKGALFYVELPRIPAPVVRSAAPVDIGAARGLDVLLVDDNEDSCELLAFALAQRGYQVSFAHSGEEGLRLALEGAFDVAIFDIGLPGLDGYELARQTRKRHGGRTPFLVALTGYGSPEDRAAALEAGFDAHVVKPIDVSKLTPLFAHVRPRR